MKAWLLLCCLFILDQPTWLTDITEARKLASEKNQHILLNFSGSDWCVPCMRMKKDFFESPDFTAYAAANLVLLKADFPRSRKNKLTPDQEKKNEALADKYNPLGKFPYTLLLDADGRVISSWEGCPDMKPVEFVEQIRNKQYGKNG